MAVSGFMCSDSYNQRKEGEKPSNPERQARDLRPTLIVSLGLYTRPPTSDHGLEMGRAERLSDQGPPQGWGQGRFSRAHSPLRPDGGHGERALRRLPAPSSPLPGLGLQPHPPAVSGGPGPSLSPRLHTVFMSPGPQNPLFLLDFLS